LAQVVSGQSLAETVTLLRKLPRHRHGEREARSLFDRFKSAHPGLPCRLVIDAKPGSDALDYDILLTIPDAGAVALSWRPDGGIPWTALYADHWAANFVLTVDDYSTSIQSALIYLGVRLRRRPDLMRELVDRSLTFAAMEDPPEINDTELELAIDEFRRAQGLFSGVATQSWLDEMQLTMETLEQLVAESLQLQKFKSATVSAAKVRTHFESHRSGFDRLTVMRLEGLTRSSARDVTVRWRQRGTCPAFDRRQTLLRSPKGRLDTLFACDLPPEYGVEPVGAVVGPIPGESGVWVGQVLERSVARFDRATRERISQLLFETWLAEKRSKASICWHWV
jgi:putative peptide maturation system protein